MAIWRSQTVKYFLTIVLLVLGAGLARAQQEQMDTLYHSQYATWVTPHYNLSACRKYKTNLDSIEKELDAAIPVITTYLGIRPEVLPQKVVIDSQSDGMGGWAGGNEVGYQISDFYGAPANDDGLRWIRGVIIGEVINASTGAVTGNWPLDWWVDHVWYFPGFMAGQILKQTVSPAFSEYWLTSEHYPTYPVYNIFVSLLGQYGWPFYKDFFARIVADGMDWQKVGDNPFKIKTDYVIAYLSMAAGRNMGGEFKRAMVEDADSTEIASIIGVENGLLVAQQRNLNVTSAWNDFRNGNYASARTALEKLGVSTGIGYPKLSRANLNATAFPATVYSLNGRKLFAGSLPSSAAAQGLRPADYYYIFKDKVILSDKKPANP